MKSSDIESTRKRGAEMLAKAGIAITSEERENLEVVDFGLGEFERTGLMLVVYINNDSYCAKEIVMSPGQTCSEHRHPPVAGGPGKLETFRCRWGKIWIYSEGEATSSPKARLPEGSERYYTAFDEVELNPGEQYTIPSDTLHWFQAGPEGVIVSEFSTTSRDESDTFTDPRISRAPTIEEG